MGRPRVEDQDKRIVQVNIRLTEDENKKVNHFASASGLSPANWIRKKVFSRKFPAVKVSPLDASIYNELKKIGVNINQATHKINLGEMPKEYMHFILQLRVLLDKVLKTLLDDRQSG